MPAPTSLLFGGRPAAIQQAAVAMEAYKVWVRKNRELVRSLENLANVISRSLLPAFRWAPSKPGATCSSRELLGLVRVGLVDPAVDIGVWGMGFTRD